VFITAYNTYAIEAFKTMALDYILKPITQEQLGIAIGKFKRLTVPKDIKQLLSDLTEKINGPGSGRFRITIGDSVKFIPYDQIICFEADQKYTTVFTKDTQYLTNKTLLELETQLPKDTFLRIHRKHIVNLNYVLEVKRWFDRKMKVVLNVPFDRELIVSRSYTEVIDKL
jgi:two-component system LytT family response regulator